MQEAVQWVGAGSECRHLHTAQLCTPGFVGLWGGFAQCVFSILRVSWNDSGMWGSPKDAYSGPGPQTLQLCKTHREC